MRRRNPLVLSSLHLGIVLHLYLLPPYASPSPSTPLPPGHLGRFGESGPKVSVEEVTGFPTPEHFLPDFVLESKPLKMTGAALIFPAFHLWTDKYLSSLPESGRAVVHVEVGKKEERDGREVEVTLSSFLDMYNDTDIYLVDEVPRHLRRDLLLPCCLQCPHLAARYLQTAAMWFSSGDTKSVVHTDGYQNVNCLLRGEKQLVLVNPSRYKVDMDRPDGSFSSMDVDRVDVNKFPWTTEVEYHHVAMLPGDCLFIPENWIHQVRSSGSNLAVNFWFETKAARVTDFDACAKECDTTWTLDKVSLTTDLKSDFLQTWCESNNADPLDVMQRLIHFRQAKLRCPPQEEQIFDVTSLPLDDLMTLEEMDENGDGILEYEELEASDESAWESVWASVDALLDRSDLCRTGETTGGEPPSTRGGRDQTMDTQELPSENRPADEL